MRSVALAVLAILCVAASAASAADWSIRSTLSNSTELNDNQFLGPTARGTIGSYSTIRSTAEALTPASKLDFDGYFNYRKYWGPGTIGITQTEFSSYGFSGKYETYGKNRADRNFIETNYNVQSAAFALLNQFAILIPSQGTINQTLTRAGIERSLSARDSISLNGQFARSFYDPSGAGTAFNDVSVSGNWQHRLGPAASVSLSSQAQFLAYENLLNTSTVILRNQAGIDATLSPVLSFRGNAGAAYVDVKNGFNALSPIGGAGIMPGGSSSNVGFITDMLLTYKALESTTFTLASTQSIGPTIVGSLFQTSTVRLGVSQTINSVSSVSAAADVNRAISTNTTDFASASITYSHQLTREWNAQVSYRYLHRFASAGTAVFDPVTGTPILSGTGPASSNSLLFVVSRNVTLLPPGK